MTGYTDDEILRHGVSSSEVPLIDKPFTPDELCRRVAEVLEPRAQAA
jgi:two-component system, cell cycle sensor histidine kinase and response regulator CckA